MPTDSLVMRTVAPLDVQQTLDEMELSLEMCTEMCQHYRGINVCSKFF
jgi:hypothetical protein